MIAFLLKIWGLTRPYKLRFVLGVIAGVLSGVAEPLLLITVAVVFRLIFPNHSNDQLNNVIHSLAKTLKEYVPSLHTYLRDLQQSALDSHPSFLFAVLVISCIPLVMIFKGVVSYLNVYLMSWVAIRSIRDLRIKAFEHLLNLPLSFFSRNSTGELMSRVGDINVLQSLVSSAMPVLIKEPVMVIVIIVGLLKIAPHLMLVSMLVFPVCIIPVAIYNRKVRKASAAIQTNAAQLSRTMYESFTGNRIIKAYNLEKTVVNQFREDLKTYISHFMRIIRSQEIPGPLIEFMGSIGACGLLLYFVSRKDATPVDFAGFVLGIFLMYRPIKNLIRLYNQIEQARAATDRIFQLMATQTTVLEPANPKSLEAHGADIHFDGIDFDYGEKPILRDIQLTVKAGQVVALVGSSGSGKTTITNLLLRFYDPMKGAVRVGGTDIREVSLQQLRSQMAIVTQETILFNDTIGNNIAMGRPGATREEIIAAAKHAHAHDFICEKPEGYDTMIGERGAKLSGGQKQRIAIARAILKDVPILILDEATSSLDNESERAVQADLEELMKGRTTICIAHRLSTIHNADLIVVMQEGRIVEMGGHAELLAKCGVYHKLYSLQNQKPVTALEGGGGSK